MGIALWLVPDATTAGRIKTVMQHRPPTTPLSPGSFPTFHPHITLASSPSATALRAALPHAQPAIRAHFRSLEVGSTYFMSVYIALHEPPRSPLAVLRAHLRTELAGAGTVPPVPHLSLYYIADADAALRRDTVDALVREGRVVQEAEENSVIVPGSTLDPELPNSIESFGELTCSEIWFVRCEGPVESWEVMEKFPLVDYGR